MSTSPAEIAHGSTRRSEGAWRPGSKDTWWAQHREASAAPARGAARLFIRLRARGTARGVDEFVGVAQSSRTSLARVVDQFRGDCTLQGSQKRQRTVKLNTSNG